MPANTAAKAVSFAGAMRWGLLLLGAVSVQAQSIAWSTFLGGTGDDRASAIATDREGNIYVAGTTNSGVFAGARVGWDPWNPSFLAKLDAAGTRLFYVVEVPGGSPRALAVGDDGSAWVTGASVTRFSPAGEVVYSTRLDDVGVGIAVDKAGNAFVLALSLEHKAIVHVTKLDGTGRVAFRYQLPAGEAILPRNIALDPDGSIWISGASFLAKLNASGTALLHSEFDVSGSLLTDPAGNVHFLELQGGSPRLFRSDDAGATWYGHRFRADWESVWDLRFSDEDSPRLYAKASFWDYWSDGIINSWYVSQDEGRAWSTLWSGRDWVSALHPTDPKILFLVVAPIFQILYSYYLQQSSDGGSTWTRIGYFGSFGRAMAVDPSSPDTLYISARDWISPSEWRPVLIGDVIKYTPGSVIGSTFLESCLSNCLQEYVTALEAAGGAMFALSSKGFLWRTVDGAGTWKSVAWGIRGIRGRAAELFAWTETGLLVSRDRGDSWTVLAEGAFYDLFFDPVATTLWARTKEGLAKSTDEGATWSIVFPGQQLSSVAVDPKRPSTVYASFWGSPIPSTGQWVLRRLDGAQPPRPVPAFPAQFAILDDTGNLHLAVTRGEEGTNGDGYLATFGPDGQLAFATSVGGSQYDFLTAMTVDKEGNVLLAGWTRSADFPVKNAIQPNYGGNTDVFVTKFAPK